MLFLWHADHEKFGQVFTVCWSVIKWLVKVMAIKSVQFDVLHCWKNTLPYISSPPAVEHSIVTLLFV